MSVQSPLEMFMNFQIDAILKIILLTITYIVGKPIVALVMTFLNVHFYAFKYSQKSKLYTWSLKIDLFKPTAILYAPYFIFLQQQKWGMRYINADQDQKEKNADFLIGEENFLKIRWLEALSLITRGRNFLKANSQENFSCFFYPIAMSEEKLLNKVLCQKIQWWMYS